ncbi:MAG: DUF2802 domain-containing protein [Bdellovibrionota bacterium]
MVYLAIILSVLNTGFLVYFVFARSHRGEGRNDEQKLSRGLQLLQSKIAVLEDLSDQVDNQVKQISRLLEGKYRELQNNLNDADTRLVEIQSQVQKGQEVSKLFRDKIPHEEMVERKNLVRYVKAAKMANAGASVEEISRVVDIPVSELEMIAKVNKGALMFNEEALPDWAKEEIDEVEIEEPEMEMAMLSRESPLEVNPKMQVAPDEQRAFKNLSDQFKRATGPMVKVPENTIGTQMSAASAVQAARAAGASAQPATQTATLTNGKSAEIKPYEFRRINGNFPG